MLPNRNLRTLLLLAFYIPVIGAFAQDRRDQNWYFGNTSRAIQFTQPGDTARLITRTGSFATYGTGGGAVASDLSTGGLLFYTDGSIVYDATHRPMPNGTGLGGNPSASQPAVIAAVPGQPNRYFIITNSATPTSPGQVFFSEVDMTLLGNNSVNPNLPAPPLGDVGGVKASALAALNNVSEAMILIPHQNGIDSWLITHEFGTDQLWATPITAGGIVPPASPASMLTSISFIGTHFAYHAPSGRIAIAPSDVSKNIMIVPFDDAAGTFGTTTFVFNSAVTSSTTSPAIFDVEWSPSGNYIYASQQGDATNNGVVMQYDLINTTVSPAVVNTNVIARSFGLQAGRDSLIYHIYATGAGGPFQAGRIESPDTIASEADYNALPLGNHDFNARQFPSFLVRTDIVMTADFDVVGTCANAPSTFFPVVTPGADSLVWDFGDGTGSTEWSPTYAYGSGNTFNVTLRAYFAGDSVVYTEAVTITQFDLQLTLVQDTTACSCELLFPKADPPPPPCTLFSVEATASGSTGAIQWFGPAGAIAGQNTLTLTQVDSAGFYYVIVQDPGGSGCAAYAGVNIKEYGVDDPRSNIWYFGDEGGINFNPDFIPATGADPIEGDLISNEGTAVVCDRNGQVILSTNGEQVFDRDGNPAPLLPMPPGLGGSQNSTQSALILPVAGDPTLYYVFVTQEIYPQTVPGYELRYAIFDLKRGANGELIDPDGDLTNGASTILFTKSTERITGNMNWLIAHEYGNNNFRAYRVSAQGISEPVISSIGSDHSLAVAENGQGYMKLSPNNILAVALSTPGVSNLVEIFDFVDSTGIISNFRQVDLQQSTDQVYGIEFSPSGTKLFASTLGAGGAIYEFAYDSVAGTYVSKPALPPIPAPQAGAIQRGPDGVLYVAIDGATSLGTLNANPDVDAPSNFTLAGFALAAGTSSNLGLPNFIQSIADPVQTPAIEVSGFCFGFPTDFVGSGTDPIDTLTWFFGDGSSMRGVNLNQVQHTYGDTGTYIVTLRLSNRCVGFIDNLVDTIYIAPIPEALSGTVTLCTGAETLEATPATNPDLADLTFLWNTGETTRLINPPGQGIYDVTVSSIQGCSNNGSYFVSDNRPQVDLGPDQTLCQNSGTITLDAQNPGSVYDWQLNGAPFATTQTITVSTATASPPDFVYTLTITDPFTTCTLTETITYTINPDPVFNAVGFDPTACGVADGRVEITITSTGTYSYSVTPGTAFGSSIAGPSGVLTAPNLTSGSYNVQVTDQVSGCFEQTTVSLSDNAFTVAIARNANCNDTNNLMPILITNTPALATFTYRILDAATTAQVTAGNQAQNPTAGVPNATYIAEVTSGGCVASSPATLIQQDAEAVLTDVIINQCTTPITIQAVASGTATYSWTGPGLTPPTTTATINPNLTASGLYNFDLVLSDVGACPNYVDVDVDYFLDPPADITPSDACNDLVTLTASPTGPYVYQWSMNGVTIPGGQQIEITTNEHDESFEVDVRNTVTGCIQTAVEQAVVLGEFTVELANTQPCEGSDFDITATAVPFPTQPFIWSVDGDIIAGQVNPTLTVSDDRSGLYKVVVERRSGAVACFAEDEVQILIAPRTAGLLTSTGIICPHDANPDPDTRQVVLRPGGENPDFISYNWFLDGVALGVTTETLTATVPGTYSVDLINSYGCPSSDQTTLIEECDPSIVAPTAFRPTSSLDRNTDFYLFTHFISDTPFEVFIFNRWGEMVFHSSDILFRWNGGYRNDVNQPLPPGTYSYVVKYQSSYRPDGILEKRGGVVLLR